MPKQLQSGRARWVALSLAALAHSSAWAGPILNGDFADVTVLSGYTVTGSVISEPTGAFAQLDTDGSFTRTLAQTFSIPATGSIFSFDFAFSTEGVAPIAGLPDSFAVSIQTIAGDLLDILVVDALGVVPDPSDGIEVVTGATAISVTFDSSIGTPGYVALGGTVFGGRISMAFPNSVLGQDATLFVDLFDQSDGFASRAAVDNFSVTARAVTEPTSLLLTGLGLIGLCATRRRGAPTGG